ncbi:sensor histidine kinase [Crassaminicella indica]|uniref:histidine kinase n=2 Tax=Crassaminicella indica TaxID=2855394 RepID=A0ABX8RE48_9CLOT|nr:sensor histidine kinase [Crassaminicella indica]
MSKLRKLCKIHTDLEDEDIFKLECAETVLQNIADLVNADVFIDCATRDPNRAIVVAEAKPTYGKSMYEGNVVGEFALRENEPAVIRTLEIEITSRDIKGITQENINVKQTVNPIKNAEGKTIGVLIVEKDITEDMHHDKKIEFLAEMNEKLTNEIIELERDKEITYHLDEGIIMFNKSGNVIYTNLVAEQLYKKLGFMDSLIGMHFNNISLEQKLFENIIEEKNDRISEIEFCNLTLQLKYIFYRNYFIIFIKDITDMRKKEKELILKSVAIKEIHHRVKNNLQTIASLLRLQSRRIENQEFKNILNESINRILSIAATHEILAQQGIDHVDIKKVISKIIDGMQKGYLSKEKSIDMEIIGDELRVDSDKATDISLIINELIQNSIQYAFEDQAKGKITVYIQKGELYSRITVVDNGKGFDYECVNPNSLGLNIVKSIVTDKLGGRMNIQSDSNGTIVGFDFKK